MFMIPPSLRSAARTGVSVAGVGVSLTSPGTRHLDTDTEHAGKSVMSDRRSGRRLTRHSRHGGRSRPAASPCRPARRSHRAEFLEHPLEFLRVVSFGEREDARPHARGLRDRIQDVGVGGTRVPKPGSALRSSSAGSADARGSRATWRNIFASFSSSRSRVRNCVVSSRTKADCRVRVLLMPRRPRPGGRGCDKAERGSRSGP